MATLRHDAPSAMGGWLVKEGSFRRRYRRYVRLKGTILSNHHSEASPATWEVNVSDVGVAAGTRTGELVLTLPDRRVSFFADSPEEAAAWTRALTAVATRRIEDAYELGSLLGEGAFATVVRGVDRATREAVAVKVIKKDAFDDREMEFVVRETAIMKSIDHPNIVAVRDVYESRSHLYLVLELLEGGELFDLVASAGSLSEQRASEVMRGYVMQCGWEWGGRGGGAGFGALASHRRFAVCVDGDDCGVVAATLNRIAPEPVLMLVVDGACLAFSPCFPFPFSGWSVDWRTYTAKASATETSRYVRGWKGWSWV